MYLMHIIFFVAFASTVFYLESSIIFWIVFIAAATNAAISGYLLIDLATEK